MDNMKLPIHRWFRYSAGFAAQWVDDLLRTANLGPGQIVFDPFMGSGTTLLAAQAAHTPSVGLEAHSFVRRIAAAKLCWTQSVGVFIENARDLLISARLAQASEEPEPVLLTRCYADDALTRLVALRRAYGPHATGPSGELLWLAITSILRECSGVGTAQWQYVLPNKSKARVRDPFEAFEAKVALMAADMAAMQSVAVDTPAVAMLDDARTAGSELDLSGKVGMVITSPPYPNNFDYADATRLEMTFWGEVANWSQLHASVRQHLVTSCSQHSAAERLVLDRVLSDRSLDPIIGELTQACRSLEVIREQKGGRKTYHTMIAAYFRDMAKVWQSLRPLCASGSRVCMVLGDSAPYGVHIPVERWMAQLAIATGFEAPAFEKLRDRNVKWKNRKHDVPLQEGRLWVEG